MGLSPAQVEKLMDQKLAAAKVQELRAILGNDQGGLQFLLSRYVAAVQFYCPNNPRCEGLSPEGAEARDIAKFWSAAQTQLDTYRLVFRPADQPASYCTWRSPSSRFSPILISPTCETVL